MALMLGALVINGIQPGPDLIVKQPMLFWGLVASMLIGNLFLLILNVPLVRVWIQLIRIPARILYPLVLVACAFGVYSINNNINDVWITAAFGALGLFFIWSNLEPAPMMLGLVLGPMLEEYFRRQMMIARGSWQPFVDRPISFAILCILLSFMIYGLWKSLATKPKL